LKKYYFSNLKLVPMKTLQSFFLIAILSVLIVSCKKEEGSEGSFTDSRDGTVYKTVKIGSQTWMAENLAYLPAVYRSSEGSETEARYYVYGYQGNDVNEAKATANYSTYGALYNLQASKAACPTGWHIPTEIDWQELEVSLGMPVEDLDRTSNRGIEEAIGNKMKSSSGWDWDDFHNADGNGNNQSGFTALPGGMRTYEGGFADEGVWGYFWSATPDRDPPTHYWIRYLVSDTEEVGKWGFQVKYGLSVRCVKN
jgi:uncharacterized protein (TIGR02145 family)